MRKFILYASMVFVLSFYAVENIEAGLIGKIKKNFKAEPTDPCAGGAVACTYVFTAWSGSNKQITLARRPVASEYGHDADDHSNHGDEYRSTDWYYYDLDIYTKTEVQAGYYISSDGVPVLVVAYSADGEGKNGAIVSRISKDYGETWSESTKATNDKRKFGLAVAPNSYIVAHVDNKHRIGLRQYVEDTTRKFEWSGVYSTGWMDLDNKTGNASTIASDGLSLIYDDTLVDGEPLVSVAYLTHIPSVSADKLQIRNYKMVSKDWQDKKELEDGRYYNDTAWLCNDTVTDSGLYLAAKRKKGNGNKMLGVNLTSDMDDYGTFTNWKHLEDSSVSGIWKCPDTDTIYILSTNNQEIKGTDSSGNRTVLYQSNQNSSFQRRVSMFNVPAKQ
jgi:hypothetical protein